MEGKHSIPYLSWLKLFIMKHDCTKRGFEIYDHLMSCDWDSMSKSD